MSRNDATSGREEPAALALDRARRAAAVRTIAGVFAVLSLVVAPAGFGFGAPWFIGVELVSAVVYAAVWWKGRSTEHPERGGIAIVAILLVQTLVHSAFAPTTMDEVNIAYSALLAPFIAAVTLGPRGVVLTGILVALRLPLQIALHVQEWSFEAIEQFIGPVTLLFMIWTVALGASLSSRRALVAHARDEQAANDAQQAAREAEERYRIVSDRMRDLIAVFDLEGRYTYVSPSHERVLGIAPDDLLARPALHLVHPDDSPAFVDAFERAKSESGSFTVTRLGVLDGTFRWFHIGLSRVDLWAARGGAIAASARDITEQRALSEALEATRRMEALGRLAGGVAHDFNNLLLVIESCTDFATARIPTDHPAQKDLADVRGAAERAAAITRQLLTFARRQVLPKHEASAVGEVFGELTPILARICGPNVALNVDARGATTVVDASPVQLEQLLMNLAANARDAMPDGGRLTVVVRDRAIAEHDPVNLPPGRYAEIEVSDTGIGMTEDVQAHIFEPFFTTKPAGRGTGLGLATVFGLVSQLGGRISVRSAPGAGSKFCVLLPEAGATRALERGAGEAANAASVSTRSLSVLVVDDEASVRALVGRILREAGHRATEAGSTEEALSETEAQGACFDAIVTDVVLGSGDGVEMLDRIKVAQPNAGIVVISGFSPSPERVADLGARGAEFLAKPFGSSELLSALGRARSRASASAANA